MDLTEFNNGKPFDTENVSSGGNSSLEPGRHTLHYAGADMIEGKNNWKAIKMLFEVDGTTIVISNTFTVGSDNAKAIDIGNNSMLLLMNAMGVGSLKNTDELVGKSVSAELVRADSGYLEIDEQFGKTWQPVGDTPKEDSSDHPDPKEVLDSDDIPF